MTENEKIHFDRTHLWHPYSGTVNPRLALHAKSADGVEIELADGSRLIDGISSWWTMAHGHRRPEIVAAIERQLHIMPHTMFGGFTHDPAIELAAKLIDLAPRGLDKVFFSDSGSVACEVAMKMALQYFHARGDRRRTRFLTVEHTYHGDTFATMALGGGSGMHRYFGYMLAEHFTAPAPAMGLRNFNPGDLDAARDVLEAHASEIAAAIIEPVLQGAGGMRIYSPEYLAGLRKLCDEFGILLIVDEIATGFGRLGKMFASEFAGVSPDIMCVGKALTGGHISLAATLATDHVARTISEGEPGVLMHGPTFMANPLACAAGCASLELFGSYDWQGRVAAIEKQLASGLAPLSVVPHVKDIRVLGAVGAVELDFKVESDRLCREFAARGCWLRPFGNIVYLMPPFVIKPEQLAKLTSAVCDVLERECH